MSQSRYDKIITARWIITVEKDGEILENHAIALKDGRIAAIIPANKPARWKRISAWTCPIMC